MTEEKKQNLHDIDDAIRDLLAANLNEETGEISEVAVEELEQLEGDREGKIIACGRRIRDEETWSGNIEKQIKKLQARKKRHDQDAEFFRGWVEQSMKKGERFETPDILLATRESTKVVLRDIDNVAHSLLAFAPAPDPVLDKMATKQWIKEHDGEVPAGVDQIKTLSLQIDPVRTKKGE